VDLHVVSEEITLMRNPLGQFDVELDLRARGALQQLEITGVATLEGARLEVDELLEQFSSSAYSVEAAEPVPEPVRQAAAQIAPNGGDSADGDPGEEPAGAQPEPLAEIGEALANTPFQNATIDVTLNMADDVVLRADDLRTTPGSMGLGSTNLTVGGDLNLRKDPGGELRMVGGVDVVRGFYDFQGRRFDIARGSAVQFHGAQPVDPTLNITATREISGVTTQVAVQGTMRDPRIQLSSYPPLDQSDILSLIIFGQPVNTLGESERVDLAQRAGSIALGALAGPLAESVGQALNLDLFEIRTAGEGGSPEVALGTQIGSRLYVGLRQEFGRDDASVVSIEYRISELLRLVTSIAQGVQQTHATRRNDPTGVDLIFLIRY
jgi:autotransporter translocation and assembly factor TamB